MPLQKQNISISFAQGLDTKTDPNQVVPGKLVSAENVTFTEGMAFNKRNGFELLSTIDSGEGIDTFKEELVGFDGLTIQGFNPANNTTVNKGKITGVDVSVQSVFRSGNGQRQQDSAWNAGGLYLYVWFDSTLGCQYMVVSSLTNQQVVAPTSLEANATFARAFSLGNYLIVTWVNSSTNHLRYLAIPVMHPSSPTAASDIATNVNAANPRYDGSVINNSLILAWNANDGGGAIRMNRLSNGLAGGTETAVTGESATTSIAVFGDNFYPTPYFWVVYYNGTDVKYFVRITSSFGVVLAPTAIETIAGILNVTGAISSQGTAQIFYQKQNTYGFVSSNGNTVRTDFIKKATATDAGVVTGIAVFIRSVGLIGKAFVYNDEVYMVVAYGSFNSDGFEPTYFVVKGPTLQIISKLAFTNGGGYPQTPNGMLTNVNALSDSQFEFAYLFKDLLTTQSGAIYTQTGVNSSILDFSALDLYQSAELGNNLNVNGGYLYGYDGNQIVEQNFHLFPEDLGGTTAGAGGFLPDNTAYSYSAVYAWTDAQGNCQRSAPSVPFTLTTGAGGNDNLNTVNIPTIRVTAKTQTSSKVVIELYRTMPSIATGIYFLVSSITSPNFNSVTVDSIAITDGLADVAGQPILYTTGGVVENTGAPAFASVTVFKNRLIGVNSEDRNQLWYSKQTIENTPVEMSDLFTIFIDPRYGEIGAISVMDDKLLIFKKGIGAIFYLIGNGPDNTGANNDFSDAIFINAVAGCDNPNSIVLTPDGTMFQANNDKGIWIVDRALGVSYIGAPVERFNSYTVTSAQLIPNTTQVRFTLSDNQPALVYDYFYKQWDTFGNYPAVASTLFESLYTYVNSAGQMLKETTGVYSDNGRQIFMSLTTGWLSLAGFQGYQRLYRLYLIGRYLSKHNLEVSVAYDYNESNTDTVRITPSMINNVPYGDDAYYGSTNLYGSDEGGPREQFRINVSRQKCQAIQISIREYSVTANQDNRYVDYFTPVLADPTPGPGLTIEAIGALVGSKGSYPRLSPGNIVSTGSAT